MLVAGTENMQLLFLEPNGMGIKKTVDLAAVPVFMLVEGQFDIDCRLYIACRDGSIYLYAKNKISEYPLIHIDSKPIGMVKMEKTIIVAAMDNNIHSFYLKGKKHFTLPMKNEIMALEKLQTERQGRGASTKPVQTILVALKNGHVRLYADKSLITTIECDDNVLGMCFGIFGREEGCLVLNHKSGAL